MNRKLILMLAVGGAVVAAVLLFPKGDLDIGVSQGQVAAAQPDTVIIQVDDGQPSASPVAPIADRSEDGSFRDGPVEAAPERYINPAAAEANARLQAPFPQWSNRARSAWKSIDYRLRQLDDAESGAIALEVVRALMEVRRETDPDIDPLLQVQSDALERLRATPNAGEIQPLLSTAEALMEELKALPPSEFKDEDARAAGL